MRLGLGVHLEDFGIIDSSSGREDPVGGNSCGAPVRGSRCRQCDGSRGVSIEKIREEERYPNPSGL